jgi:hypothetical protein
LDGDERQVVEPGQRLGHFIARQDIADEEFEFIENQTGDEREERKIYSKEHNFYEKICLGLHMLCNLTRLC